MTRPPDHLAPIAPPPRGPHRPEAAALSRRRGCVMSTNKDDIAAGMGAIGCLMILLFIIGWVIYAVYPSTEDPDCLYTRGCHEVLTACMIAFRTDNVRLEQYKGGSLSVYIDRHTFEDIPFPDRDRMLKPIVEDWCTYHGGPLFPSLWFVDMRTGETLKQYGCVAIAVSRAWEKASKSKPPQQKQAPVPKDETPEQIEDRIRKQRGLPPRTPGKAETPREQANRMLRESGLPPLPEKGP